jgi:hypothetical protein
MSYEHQNSELKSGLPEKNSELIQNLVFTVSNVPCYDRFGFVTWSRTSVNQKITTSFQCRSLFTDASIDQLACVAKVVVLEFLSFPPADPFSLSSFSLRGFLPVFG